MMNTKKFVYLFGIIVIFVACSTAYKTLQPILPDISGKQDGVYNGEFNVEGTPVKVTLNVSVLDGQIYKIDIIRHICSPIGKKAEDIIHQIIKHQSLDVDVVSGATASSKGILKAVENALQ